METSLHSVPDTQMRDRDGNRHYRLSLSHREKAVALAMMILAIVGVAYIISNISNISNISPKEQKVTLSGPYKFEYNQYTLLPYATVRSFNDYYYIRADLNVPLQQTIIVELEKKEGTSWNPVTSSQADSTGKSITFLIYPYMITSSNPNTGQRYGGTYTFRAFVPNPEVGSSGAFSNELSVKVVVAQ